MKKVQLINFTLFQDWLLCRVKKDKAYVIASGMRSLEDYLIYLVEIKEYLYTSSDTKRKKAPIRFIYDKLLDSSRALKTKSRRLETEQEIVDMFREIFDVLKNKVEYLSNYLDSSEGSKLSAPLSAKEQMNRNKKRCSEWKTDLRYYIKFLESMFGLTCLESGCMDKFAKTGRKMGVITSDVPVDSSLFKKGIVHAMREAHVVLTSGPNKIELTMDALVNLLEKYTELHKQTLNTNSTNIFKGISLVTSLGKMSEPSSSPCIKIRTWETAFLKRAKIKVNGEDIRINDNDNVLFNSEELTLTIYNNEDIRHVSIPLLCLDSFKRRTLHIRPSRTLSIQQEYVYLSELCTVCHRVLDEMCMRIPFGGYKSEACKFIERINSNFNKLQSDYELEQAELDECSGKKCSRYNLTDLRRCLDYLLNDMDPQYLIDHYRMVCEIIQEYGSHYEIELVAE